MNIETKDFLAFFGPTGNLVRLFFKPCSCEIFHWCNEESELLAHPQYYGVPLLFPPNRTENGSFRFQDRVSRMKINDPVNHYNVHGFLLDKRPGKMVHEGDLVRSVLRWTPQDTDFAGFPHEFELVMEYRFGPGSVHMETTITNHSGTDMPCGIGFHTAFAAPRDEKIFLHVPNDGTFWHVHPSKRLPDGTKEKLSPEVAAVLDGKEETRFCNLGAQFSARNGGECFQILRKEVLIRYAVDPKFRFFAVWNGERKRDLICLEPMSQLANAPNLPLPPQESGVRALAPGETIVFVMEFLISPREN